MHAKFRVENVNSRTWLHNWQLKVAVCEISFTVAASMYRDAHQLASRRLGASVQVLV